MQPSLLTIEPLKLDLKWFRAAIRECIKYDEHGHDTEVVNGKTVCWNCGGEL